MKKEAGKELKKSRFGGEHTLTILILATLCISEISSMKRLNTLKSDLMGSVDSKLKKLGDNIQTSYSGPSRDDGNTYLSDKEVKNLAYKETESKIEELTNKFEK